jgi:flagellar biosynthetic protein FliR
MAIDPIISHALPYLMVVFRLSGLFLLAPYISGVAIPGNIRILLVVIMGACVYPIIPPAMQGHAAPDLDLMTLLPAVVGELLIGGIVGFIASLPLMSLESAGTLIGQQMGFGLARVYNPEADFDADLIGQLLFYLGGGAFLAFGGMEALFLGVIRTFEHVPAGGIGLSAIPLDAMVGTLGAGFELALRVSAPVTGIIFLLVILFGAVGKTMPQINIMSVGFTIKIIAGLSVLALAIHAIDHAAGIEVGRVMRGILRWTQELRAN